MDPFQGLHGMLDRYSHTKKYTTTLGKLVTNFIVRRRIHRCDRGAFCAAFSNKPSLTDNFKKQLILRSFSAQSMCLAKS